MINGFNADLFEIRHILGEIYRFKEYDGDLHVYDIRTGLVRD